MLNSQDDIIKSYVDICNKALALNKDRFPFKQILGAAKSSESGKKIEVHIEGGLPKVFYVFTLEDNKILAMPHDECENCQCDRQWVVELQYLKNVVHHADLYVNNPAKINWDWIYNNTTTN